MGLHKQYMRVGQSAKNSLFGIKPSTKTKSNDRKSRSDTPRTLQMLISHQGKFNHCRVSLILLGIATLVLGIVLSCVPWLDWVILKNLRLFNGSLAFRYWQKPGVIRLTKMYIYNISNPEAFLAGEEKPKLHEVGPFVYREDMEKVNIKFHENQTVSYQHKKILKFVPEMSINPDSKIIVPNIPLLSLSTLSNSLGFMIQKTISLVLTIGAYKPFVNITAEELVFGYDDTLVALAHRFYPKNKRPASKMGLLVTRNGTLKETHLLYTGLNVNQSGLLHSLNGQPHLPYWRHAPCNQLQGASEGSLFPPPALIRRDTLWVYDKDVCRVLPLTYTHEAEKRGVKVGVYSPPPGVFSSHRPENKCYGEEVEDGLQYIGPCQSDAPIYISFPHFYQADPKLLDAVEGLKPEGNKHKSYFMINPKLGVPMEGKIRVQLNIRVERARNIETVKNFPSIVFPIMWVEEGVDDVSPEIRTLVYLATVVADLSEPIVNYGLITLGSVILITIFVKAYKSVVFSQNTIDIGMKTLRRGSFIVNGQHRLMIVRDSYTLLNSNTDV